MLEIEMSADNNWSVSSIIRFYVSELELIIQ